MWRTISVSRVRIALLGPVLFGACGWRTASAVPWAPPPPRVEATFDPGFAEPKHVIHVAFDAAQTGEKNGEALENVLENLKAGDRVVIGPGTYVLKGRVTLIAPGTEADAITVEASEKGNVHLHRPDETQNVLDVDRASFLTIRGIEFSGGSIGVRVHDVHHLYFVANEVHHTGDAAITANSANTHHLYFVDNHVHHTSGHGEGFYIGANNAKAITHDSFIAGNHVHDTGGKQGDGIELKTGSYACVIAENVVERTNYPGILVYGNGGRPERNVIEKNVIVQTNDAGIQVAAQAIVRNNLVIRAENACIASRPHQGASPVDLEIVHNTLVNDGPCFRGTGWTTKGLVFANNVLCSLNGKWIVGETGFGNAATGGNVMLFSLSAFENVTLDGKGRDATPRADSAIVAAGDPRYAVEEDRTGAKRAGSLESGAVDLR